MDIRWLQTFVAAAHYENFRQASEKLFLAQPTVTVHIKHLELLLGSALFERKGRNVRLTSAGRRFLPHARQILENYDAGIHDLESWRQGYQQKITLAVSPLIAASILPPLIRIFIRQQPEIEISVQVLESKDIGDVVAGGLADLGLSRMNPVHSSLQVRKLYADPVILVVPHDGGDPESSPPLEIDELMHENIILTYNHPEYWDDLLMRIHRQYPRIRTMAVSQVHVTKRFIEEGLGISFLPRSTVTRELIEGRILEVPLAGEGIELPAASTYLVTPSETADAQLFRDFLLNFYGEKT